MCVRFLVFLILMLGCLREGYAGSSSQNIKQVNTEELSKWLTDKKKLVVVDVRSARFDDRKRLPGALNIPYNTPQKEILEKIPSKDALVVVYCGSIKCPSSQYMAERLVRMGYKTVYKYPQGISAWTTGGRPIEISTEAPKPELGGEIP